jgi:hypothetical protein
VSRSTRRSPACGWATPCATPRDPSL